MNKITRRNLLAAVSAAPLVATVAAAQDAPPANSREEDFKTARELITNNAALLAKVEVPMDTEPAFIFRA